MNFSVQHYGLERSRTRRDGTGRVNPVQGQAVHEQQRLGTRTKLDTLVSPTQVGTTTYLNANPL